MPKILSNSPQSAGLLEKFFGRCRIEANMRLLTVSYSECEKNMCELSLLGLHTISKHINSSGDTEVTVLIPERFVSTVIEALRKIK